MTKPEAIFISGIDTDAGKTYATAFYARMLMEQGYSVITQKFIQTGCRETSEDIEAHRRLLDQPLLPEDKQGLTAPVIFSYPASAQLAAKLDGKSIEPRIIDAATEALLANYDRVLIEGAGGLMVPLDDDFFTADYVASRRLPLVLVTNSRLGSINHTILSLRAVSEMGIELRALIFNHHFDSDKLIARDTREFVERYLASHFPGVPVLDLPSMN
ncbi:MAG: dethiobiotin synthase [Muribaculaceae bacterium]|nr:dethiobiotin synthase [Muribaculaceae bacterium]